MNLFTLPRRGLVSLVTLYQRTLSPDYGWFKSRYPYGFCPQHPTCSEYAKQIILERGAVIGSLLAFKRVLSCHPWKKPTDEKLRILADSALHGEKKTR